MAVSELHRQVAATALAAAAGHGFALGGGNALLAHGIISRPTQDVDLFTDQEHGVEAAADAVEAALRGAGFTVERQQADDGGLADIFPDPGEGLAEWIVSSPRGAQILLQLAYFDRSREPVVMEIGPVLAVEAHITRRADQSHCGSSSTSAESHRRSATRCESSGLLSPPRAVTVRSLQMSALRLGSMCSAGEFLAARAEEAIRAA